MALQLPVLDDRTFEQLLDEAKRRIPVHTPEWTNFEGESDPGITLVELFAFLTDNLLYRANRVPELNRLKFLQLLGLPLQAAAPAQGIVTITNERGPVEALPLDRGVVLAAGNVEFVTRDGLTVLPIQGQVYYKLKVADADPRQAEFAMRYEAVRLALEADEEEAGEDQAVKLAFYEPTLLPAPKPGVAPPVLNLSDDTVDGALYVALLAPQNVDPALVRGAIANEVLSIGIAPALREAIPPLRPRRTNPPREPIPRLLYEIPDVRTAATGAAYTRLPVVQEPDVLNRVGVVQLQLPDAASLATWEFSNPLSEGVEDFPPRIEDERVRERLVTWVRLRLDPAAALTAARTERLTWVGVNAASVVQAVPVVGETLGLGTGEPDQVLALARRPVLPDSIQVVVEGENGVGERWRMTDDLAAARLDESVFALDAAAGLVSFGSGLHGRRPPARRRIVASYESGGGVAGNVAVGAIKSSPDVRLGAMKIENPLPTWGGDTGETVAEAERNLPAAIRHRDRVVTEQDFRDVVMRTPGVDVGRVDVLPLFLADAPLEDSPGAVTVMVVPRFDATRPRWPVPDRLFLRAVCDHLDERRLITTEIHVNGPVYRDVYVTIGIQVQAGHFPDVVRQAVRARLYEYLSALPPGGPDETGWPLRKRLIKKDLEAVATRVPGVEFVPSSSLGVVSSESTEEHLFTGLELPFLRNISVVEGQAEELATIVAAGATTGMPVPEDRFVPIPVSRATC
jgi:predicted phage baseplate assembly protein